MRIGRKLFASHQVDATVVVATSAVREAKNGQEFLTFVKKKTGFEIEVLSGEEEARRTLLGIEFGLPSEVSSLLGLDIGGGSTEFIQSVNQEQPKVASLDLGVVRLSERCFKSDPPTQKEVEDAELLIRNELKTIPWLFEEISNTTLVGTAGTVTTLAAMAQALPQYDHARVHNYWLSRETIHELEKELCSRHLRRTRSASRVRSGSRRGHCSRHDYSSNSNGSAGIYTMLGQRLWIARGDYRGTCSKF